MVGNSEDQFCRDAAHMISWFFRFFNSDFFHLFGNGTHTCSIGKNFVVFPPIGKNGTFRFINMKTQAGNVKHQHQEQ